MVVCNNCGTTVADGAKFCVECGTPIPINETDKEDKAKVKETENKDLKLFLENLRKALEQAVYIQRDNSKDCFMIVQDEEEWDDNEDLLGVIQSVSNCCFMPNSGEEVFANTLNDGKPHLFFHMDNVQLDILGGVGATERFIASSIYKQCVHMKTESKFGHNDYFYIDCGADVDMMIDIMAIVLNEVCDWKPSSVCNLGALFVESKKKAQKEAVKEAQHNVQKRGMKIIGLKK